jgi:LacI family transcriptional regulator
MATMRDVAERAGVSPKTVSRVINDDRYVSDAVRDRVQQAVSDLEYVPNMLAVTFRNGRDAAIGIAVPDIGDPFFGAIVQSVEREAAQRGAAVIVTSVGYQPDHERTAIEALLRRQVIGLIVCPVAPDQSYLRPWQPRTPTVFIDRAPHRLTADAVVQDDHGGGREATAHLLGHGHQRIAFLGDDDGLATTVLRLEGYRAALSDAGVEADPDLLYLGATDMDSVADALEQLLKLADPPTAVFASNARCTVGVVPALQTLGRTDLGLVSFGDFPLAAALQPPITVVDQDPTAMGAFAAQRLFTRVDNPGARLRRRTVLPVRLVERASCGVAH